MLRLSRAIGRRQDRSEAEQTGIPLLKPQERRSSLHITPEMAEKLFGEPEPVFTPRMVHEPPKPADPEPDATCSVEKPELFPKNDPSDNTRGAAEAEPRFRALLGATTGKARCELAASIPEPRSPHSYLSELKTEVLRLVYIEGKAYTEVGLHYGLGFSTIKRMAQEALCDVALYSKHPERVSENVPRCFDPALQQLILAKCVEEKRVTAKRHPELKMLLEKLTEREAEVLHALYWQDRTLQEVGEGIGISRERVRQIANKGLQKLKYHDSLMRRRHGKET